MTPEPNAATAQVFVGPHDRETFYAAQRRNRRATWRITFLCIFAALLMGFPLTLILTPLLYLVMMIIAEIVNQASPLPAAFWDTMHTLAHQTATAIQSVSNAKPVDPSLLLTAPWCCFCRVLFFR